MEPDQFTIDGRHRQRGTLRLVTYWASGVLLDKGTTFYVATLSDEVGVIEAPQRQLDFDRALMTADEAVRADIGRYIDATDLGPGNPPKFDATNPGWF
jgi:hypothetical protein